MLGGRHYQNAYVTRNIEAGVAEIVRRTGVRDVRRSAHPFPVWMPSGSGTLLCKLAFIWIGNLQYELIEPVEGPVDLYRDWLPDGDGLRFHHSCARVADWDEFRIAVDRQDLPVVLEGGGSELRFLYLDARSVLGHYLEYIWMTPERWASLGRDQDAASGA